MRGTLVTLLLALGATATGLTAPPVLRVAAAAPVAGKVNLPAELRTGRRLQGYWRLENGVVPVASPGGRGDTVVVLVGAKGQAPAAKTVTVELAGLQANPPAVVVGEGSVVEFKNGDRVAHDLSTPEQSSVMAIERLPPGAVRRQKFLATGGYQVRCNEYPHLGVSVLVVDSPYFAIVDDKGAFKLPDVPDGKATLKVWSQGRWVHEQEIDTTRAADLQVRVASPGAKAAE
jgi:plastocyanin